MTLKSLFLRSLAAKVTLWCLSVTLVGMSCEQKSDIKVQVESAKPMKAIEEVIKIYADSLMAIPGVVGLYHGQDEHGAPCLQVMVKKRSPELEKRIPKHIEGYPVVIDETGEIRPMK